MINQEKKLHLQKTNTNFRIIKSNLFKFILIISLLIISYEVHSEILGNVNYGFDKFLNTFQFRGDANVNAYTNYGDFSIIQSYNGIGLTGLSSSFREDENFSFLYRKSLDSNFNLRFKQNWNLSTDTRNIGLNNLERLNGVLLLNFLESENYFIEFGAGVEKNEQVGIKTDGNIIQLNAIAKNIKSEDYLINSNVNLDRLALKDNRNFNLFNAESNLITISDNNNSLEMFAKYRTLERDLISQFNTIENGRLIENRIENRISTGLNFLFEISEHLNNSLNFTFDRQFVNKKFNDFNIDNRITSVERKLTEDITNAIYNFNINYNDFRQNFTINWLNRTEVNNTTKLFDILESDLNIIRNQENQRDNRSSQIRINGNTFYNLSTKDTLNFSFSNSLLRYDTPSNANNDDRDELNQNIAISYGRNHKSSFNNVLNFNLKFEYINNHLIFIKSSRSALNNVNRILKLTPSVYYKNEYLSFKPEFDLTANYTIYDFENTTSGIRSFSFRQIAYRDSVNIKLLDRFEIDFNIFYRYFERGIFFNKTFAELPQNSNLEQFVKLMIVVGNRVEMSVKRNQAQSQLQSQLESNSNQEIQNDFDNSSLDISSLDNNTNNQINNTDISNQNSNNNSNPNSNKNSNQNLKDGTNILENLNKSLVYGLGIRYFKLEQNNLQQISSNFNIPNFTQTSIAPETSVTYYFNKNNSVTLSGWYEFRYVRNKVQQIPNLVLFTTIFF